MLIGFQIGIRFHTHNRTLCSLNPSFHQRFNLYQTLALEMGSENPPKRPICSSCSKPIRLCLCARFKSPLLDNSIFVTILQHNQEKKHPLNSTRIATLGLKNLTVATVSDVHFEAKFLIRLLKPDLGGKNCSKEVASDRIEEPELPQKATFGSDLRSGCVDGDAKISKGIEKSLDVEQVRRYLKEKKSVSINADRQNCGNCLENGNFVKNPDSFTSNNEVPQVKHEGSLDISEEQLKKPDFVRNGMNPMGNEEEEPVITATIAKCGFTCSLTELQTPQNYSGIVNFDQLLDTQVGRDAVSNGFAVKKLHKKKLGDIVELQEFEIVIPPGSALLFPTKKSIGVGAVGFEVKHLIVLDGTWAKAKRMYHENPWLKLLPHLKLDPIDMSLYSEVRHQPKEGCLSTIESVVCALRALGNDHEKLDNLLDVFESMVVDQRRCKDERLSQVSPL